MTRLTALFRDFFCYFLILNNCNILFFYCPFHILIKNVFSGFLGLVLGMLHCKLVHVYEYVPSMRLTKRCHYYDENENLGCTIGDWHPLAAEKILALALNIGNDTEVFAEGYLTIPGLHGIQCANNTQ